MELCHVSLPELAVDLMFGSGNVPGTAAELEPVEGGAAARAGCQQHPGERGSEEHVPRQTIDVVLDHCVAELDQAGQPGLDPDRRPHPRRPEPGRFRLLSGVKAHRNDGTHMQPEQVSCLPAHDHLTGSARIGHAPLDDGDPVLIEIQAVDAADGGHLGADRGALDRGAISPQHDSVRLDGDLGPPDLGQVGNRAGEDRQASI